MIRGFINDNLEIVVQLAVHGPNGQELRIQAIVDTGFDGALTLPTATIRQLGLPWLRSDCLILADGSSHFFDVYGATVIWDRRSRRISIHESETPPLVGTDLLEGHELNAEFVPGGIVTIRSLRRRRRP